MWTCAPTHSHRHGELATVDNASRAAFETRDQRFWTPMARPTEKSPGNCRNVGKLCGVRSFERNFYMRRRKQFACAAFADSADSPTDGGILLSPTAVRLNRPLPNPPASRPNEAVRLLAHTTGVRSCAKDNADRTALQRLQLRCGWRRLWRHTHSRLPASRGRKTRALLRLLVKAAARRAAAILTSCCRWISISCRRSISRQPSRQ